MNEISVQNKYNNYPDIIRYDNINPVVRVKESRITDNKVIIGGV